MSHDCWPGGDIVRQTGGDLTCVDCFAVVLNAVDAGRVPCCEMDPGHPWPAGRLTKHYRLASGARLYAHEAASFGVACGFPCRWTDGCNRHCPICERTVLRTHASCPPCPSMDRSCCFALLDWTYVSVLQAARDCFPFCVWIETDVSFARTVGPSGLPPSIWRNDPVT